MLKDPPLLTIRRHFARPATETVEPFSRTPTAHAVDAQGGRGAMDYRIKPLDQNFREFAGAAITCHCGPADNLALFAAVAVAQPGDVIVASTDDFTQTCLTGDLLLRMATNRGVRAFVTDGLIRDCAGIRELQLPIFCRGVSPNSPTRNGPGTIGLPVSLGTVTVNAGDIVIGDEDGVVVVPLDDSQRILDRIEAISQAEAKFEEQVREGLTVPDFISSLLESDRVVYLD